MYGTDSDSVVVNGLLKCMVDIGNEVGVPPEDQQNGALEIIAAIRQLKLERDMHKAAEEAQIALRQKVDERVAELEAHVERLFFTWDQLTDGGASTQSELIDPMDAIFGESPATSLARRNLLKQAEALENMADTWGVSSERDLRNMAEELRQQAEVPQ